MKNTLKTGVELKLFENCSFENYLTIEVLKIGIFKIKFRN